MLGRLAPETDGTAGTAAADWGRQGAIALAVARERPLDRVPRRRHVPPRLRCAAHAAAWVSTRVPRSDVLALSENVRTRAVEPAYLADDDPHLREGDLASAAMAIGSGRAERSVARSPGGPGHLAEGGWLLFEQGGEGEAARALLAHEDCEAVQSWRDPEAAKRQRRSTSG